MRKAGKGSGRRGRGFVGACVEALEERRMLAAADLDLTFGNEGVATFQPNGSLEDRVNVIGLMPDGRFVVAGGSFCQEGLASFARYLPDGQPDESFADHGRALIAMPNPVDCVLGADGSIVTLALSDPAGRPLVQKLTPQGTLDPSWVGPGSLGGRSITALSDGCYLVVTGNSVVRLNADGSLDSTFGTRGKISIAQDSNGSQLTPYTAAECPDGSIIVGGERHGLHGGYQPAVRRYFANGQIDASFGGGIPGGTRTLTNSDPIFACVHSILLLSDGRIVAAGESHGNSLVARLTSSGTMDTTFAGTGVKTFAAAADQDDAVADLTLLADGRLVCVGSILSDAYHLGTPYLARLTSNGQLDPSFAGDGIVERPFPAAWGMEDHGGLAVQPDGKVLLAGSAYVQLDKTFDYTIARYGTNGTLDLGFGNQGIVTTDFTGPLSVLMAGRSAVQPDGKTVFSVLDSPIPSPALIGRLNADGTPDQAFGINGFAGLSVAGARNADIWDTVVQADGKIVFVGQAGPFDRAAGFDYDYLVARLNPDGTPDDSFGIGGVVRSDFGGTGISQVFSRVLVQPDGKIVAAGLYDDGNRRLTIVVRYSSDGQLDGTFGSGGKQFMEPLGTVIEMQYVGGGKILLGGTVSTLIPNSSSSNKNRFVIRLNADGSTDTTFATNGTAILDTGSDDELMIGMWLDSADNIFIAGRSIPTSGNQQFSLTKLAPNGVPVAEFGTTGSILIMLPDRTDWLYRAIPTANGQCVLVATRDVGLSRALLVMRLDGDGGFDATFGAGGTKTFLGNVPQSYLDAHTTLSGYIVVTGVVRPDGETTVPAAVRLVGDGAVATAADAGGPYLVNEGSAVTLSGIGFAPPGKSITGYEWDLNYDGVTFDVDASGAIVSASATQLDGPATRKVALRAIDSTGATSPPDIATVTIANVAPTGVFSSCGSICAGQLGIVTFVNPQDPSPADLAAGFKYSYDFDGDGVFEIVDSDNERESVPADYLSIGTHTVRGRIADKDGGYTDYTTQIVVRAKPTANAGGPYAVDEGATVVLVGRATVEEGQTVAAYEWDLNYDGNRFDVDATGAAPVFSAASIDGPAVRTIALRVRDDRGLRSDITTATVSIANVAPVARIDSVPVSVRVGEAVNVAGAYSDACPTDAVTLSWSVIDAGGAIIATGNGAKLSFTPAVAGVYRVVLTAADDDGGIGTAAAEVAVLLPPISVSGSMYNDANGDGRRNAWEKVLVGQKVYLDLDEDGVQDASEPVAVTDGLGIYRFEGLEPGSYRVRAAAGAGWRVSGEAITYQAGGLGEGRDFAAGEIPLTQTARVEGSVFLDANGNRKRDKKEKGKKAVRLFLDRNNNGKLDKGELSARTSATGGYVFSAVPAGRYTLRVLLPKGHTQTMPKKPAALKLSAGQVVAGKVFGIRKG